MTAPEDSLRALTTEQCENIIADALAGKPLGSAIQLHAMVRAGFAAGNAAGAAAMAEKCAQACEQQTCYGGSDSYMHNRAIELCAAACRALKDQPK